jgi:non-canonical purine NTP pyrophosphatase (RdgB/HAM1 family)
MLYWQKYITDRKRGKKMEELVIATHNPGKVEEFKTLMQDLHLTFKCLSDFPPVATPAETGRTFAANAKQKAIYYAKALNAYCLADDSGLEVKALDGAPGVHSARYAGEEASDKENNDLLLQNMKFEAIRTCRFRCAWLWLIRKARLWLKLMVFVMACSCMSLWVTKVLAMILCFGQQSYIKAWGKLLLKRKTALATEAKLFVN